MMAPAVHDVTGSLLTIGDEILLGDILNTNAHHIAAVLRAHGFRLNRVITVEDREETIAGPPFPRLSIFHCPSTNPN